MRWTCYSFLILTTLSQRSSAFFSIPFAPSHHHHRSTLLQHDDDDDDDAFRIYAKKNRRGRTGDDDDMNRWYDAPSSDSSPEDVFWEENERQRLLNEIGSSQEQALFVAAETAARAVASTASSLQGFQNKGGSTTASQGSFPNKAAAAPTTLEQQMDLQARERTTENTLTEYMAHQVEDNWINERLIALHGDQYEYGPEVQLEPEEQDALIQQELEEASKEGVEETHSWDTGAEPWDIWGQPRSKAGDERSGTLQVNFGDDNEFLRNDDDEDDDDGEGYELEFMERMKDCHISSARLEKARDNPKAKKFFEREPDALEGYDRMWVSAIDHACFRNLQGSFRNYGIQFADNFGDFENGAQEDGFYSIEDVASWKARKLYEVTGLPVVTARTSFEVEPISPSAPGQPTSTQQQAPPGIVPPRPTTPNTNPMISSGYRFNDIGDHVDHMIEALKPVSAPNRVTRYRTCLCFYDGDMELYEFSTLECDLHWATSLRTFIPVNQAINQICKTLQLTFGLEYMKWLKLSQAEASSRFSNAVTQLRDRVLKDGRVLPNSIIDVSAFMDSMVDVNLMDDCARELSERFKDLRPTKILTVATTGLVIALPMAKYLQVPVVYARKERNVVMADTFKANYSSKTVGKNNELLVSKKHLTREDRILVVDDFLSSGTVQDALFRIVSDAEATVVGVGVLLEKVYDSGRQSLSGYDVPVESLCRVASVKEGAIQLLEEEGFDLM